MLKTTKELVNKNQFEEILKDIVQLVYENIKNEYMLLNITGNDIDLYVALEGGHDEFEEAIEKNFEYDEDGELVDEDGYKTLMDELNDYFVEIHKTSVYFDYFPAGVYLVNGEERQIKSEYIAVKGEYQAPFEDARLIVH